MYTAQGTSPRVPLIHNRNLTAIDKVIQVLHHITPVLRSMTVTWGRMLTGSFKSHQM